MKTKKNDLVEIEFSAKTEDGQVFDTTNKQEALNAGLIEKDSKQEFKPRKFFVGRGQIIKGFDIALEDKEPEKDYDIEVKVKDAYGNRETKLIKTLPLHAFEQVPVRGMFVNINGLIAKFISVTGGRVLVDFNHPLAGKNLRYQFKILKILEDDKDKISALAESFTLKPEINEENGKFKLVFKEKIPEEIVKRFEKELKEIVKKEISFELPK